MSSAADSLRGRIFIIDEEAYQVLGLAHIYLEKTDGYKGSREIAFFVLCSHPNVERFKRLTLQSLSLNQEIEWGFVDDIIDENRVRTRSQTDRVRNMWKRERSVDGSPTIQAFEFSSIDGVGVLPCGSIVYEVAYLHEGSSFIVYEHKANVPEQAIEDFECAMKQGSFR